jgi:hypothetical protein
VAALGAIAALAGEALEVLSHRAMRDLVGGLQMDRVEALAPGEVDALGVLQIAVRTGLR